jgi:hypothetical protein
MARQMTMEAAIVPESMRPNAGPASAPSDAVADGDGRNGHHCIGAELRNIISFSLTAEPFS